VTVRTAQLLCAQLLSDPGQASQLCRSQQIQLGILWRDRRSNVTPHRGEGGIEYLLSETT